MGLPHCNVECDPDGTVTWWQEYSVGETCEYYGLLTLTPAGLLTLEMWNIQTSTPVHVVTYSASGTYATILASGLTLTKDFEGSAAGVCTSWPATAVVTVEGDCDIDYTPTPGGDCVSCLNSLTATPLWLELVVTGSDFAGTHRLDQYLGGCQYRVEIVCSGQTKTIEVILGAAGSIDFGHHVTFYDNEFGTDAAYYAGFSASSPFDCEETTSGTIVSTTWDVETAPAAAPSDVCDLPNLSALAITPKFTP